MSTYWLTFKLSLQTFLEYRYNLLLQILGSVIFYISAVVLWIAIYQGKDSIGGYTTNEIVTYILGNGLLNGYIFYVSIGDEIDRWIRRGILSSWLTKPFNIPIYWFTDDLARRIFSFTLNSFGFAIVILFFREYLFFPKSFITIVYAMVIVFLAGIINYLIFHLTGILAFWLEETWGLRFLLRTFLWIASGAIIPLTFLPGIIGTIIKILPFKYMFFVPMQVYLEKTSGVEIFYALIGEMVWIIVLYLVAKIIWKRGIKHYTAVGG